MTDASKLEAQKQLLSEARRFFELTTTYYYMTRNFVKADEQFAVLSHFYDNCCKNIPASELESKVITLRLVHLFAQGSYEEFHTLNATVPAELKERPEFKQLREFVYFMEIGSFKNASDAIGKISLVHKAVLSQIEDSLREE